MEKADYSSWRMRCYYCDQYKNGTCPYEKRRTVPKKCRKFINPSMRVHVPEFTGFEKVIIAVVLLFVSIIVMLFVAGLIMLALSEPPI